MIVISKSILRCQFADICSHEHDPMQSIKGQLGEPLRMRRNITNENWHQIKTAYASGIGLREIARKMGIPPGTILSARAWRDSNPQPSDPKLEFLFLITPRTPRNLKFGIGQTRQGLPAVALAKAGGRRDSNPQQPEPQSGALPLSYDHHYCRRNKILKFESFFANKGLDFLRSLR